VLTLFRVSWGLLWKSSFPQDRISNSKEAINRDLPMNLYFALQN